MRLPRDTRYPGGPTVLPESGVPLDKSLEVGKTVHQVTYVWKVLSLHL